MTSIVVGKDRINLLESERYLAGTKNLYTIKVAFSDDWCDLEKRITFKTDKFEMSVAILGMCETLPIPWEVFREPSNKLQVGAYGYRCNELALNTRWASLGRVWKGILDSVCGCGHPTGPIQPSPKSFEILQAMIERKADRLTYEDEMLTLWSGDEPLSAFEFIPGTILPTGGLPDQVLAKASDKDGDYYWMTLPEISEVPSEPDEPTEPEPPKEITINLNIPRGMIFLWFGPLDSIPPGYSLCDGQNGTVDLRNVFIVGAGDKFEPGDTNRPGSDDGISTASLLPDPEPTPDPEPEPDISYYALAFIQKTSLESTDVDGGMSAYEIALANGFKGTEVEWLESLHGKPGKSAYEIAVENGFTGTVEEWTQQIISNSTISVISDVTIDSVATAPANSGDYIFKSVKLSTKGITRANFVSFMKNVVHVDITTENIIVTLLSNERYVCELNASKDIIAIEHKTLVDQITSIAGETIPGAKGEKGDPGDSAYQIAVANGFVGTEKQWLDSLKGDFGDSAYKVAVANGFVGTEKQWLDSLKGDTGKSAYDIALDHGFQGTEEEWLESLKGESNMYGKSAYEIAVEYGFVGTVPEWLESLKGAGGKSAYQIALDHGFVGTEAEWLESLKGSSAGSGKGDKGDPGDSAYQIAVKNGFVGTEQQWLESLKGSAIPTLTVIENQTIDSRDKIPETGSYIFRNVVLAATKLSRSAPVTGYRFPDDVVYVNKDYESQITVDTLDNKHLVCLFNSIGMIIEIKEEQFSTGDGNGLPGKSAYEIAVANGFVGTEQQWLESLKGEKGGKGDPGLPGDNGVSAYDIAVENGFTGNEQQWLESLKGEKGDNGKSAYELAVSNGYSGTEADWLETLKGKTLRGLPDYSTGELIAGRWIDDRPIYRKVIRTTVTTNSNETIVATVDNAKPVHMYGTIESQNGNALCMVPGVYDAQQYGFIYEDATGEVKLWSSESSIMSKELMLVLEYVKDNDGPLNDDDLIIDSSNSGGTKDHRELTNRDAQSQHPISAIDGLQTILNNTPTQSITDEELEELFR